MPDFPDGEGPVTRDEARERVKGWIDKPEHKPKKDKEKHEDALDDPALQETLAGWWPGLRWRALGRSEYPWLWVPASDEIRAMYPVRGVRK